MVFNVNRTNMGLYNHSKSTNNVIENQISNSAEVAVFVAGYIDKKLTERSKCECCKSALTCNDIYPDQCYFTLISRGGLTKPSPALAEFVIHAFALLDVLDSTIMKHQSPAKMSAEKLLSKYLPAPRFTCNEHTHWGLKW